MLCREAGPTALRAELRARLRMPAVVAPMFSVSGPDLVLAAWNAGLIGAFPSTNAKTPELLEEWLRRIAVRRDSDRVPYALNLIVHRSNVRLEPDLALAARYRVPIVITSVGAPTGVAARIHDYGGIVLADVASVRHAHNAIGSGADGLVLLTAGAGGQTGRLNPFAFIAEVRQFFEGPIAVAGSISHGRELRALELLGADLAYMGTAFLASEESMATAGHKQAAVESNADDIILTDAVTGIPGSFMRAGLKEIGLLDRVATAAPPKNIDISSWSNVWSAGHGVGHVRSIQRVADIVSRIETEYRSPPMPIRTPSSSATIGPSIGGAHVNSI
jgi:nitronate monooxygenase